VSTTGALNSNLDLGSEASIFSAICRRKSCDGPPPGTPRPEAVARVGVRKVAVVGPTAEQPIWPIIRNHAAALEAADRHTRFVFFEPTADTPLALRQTLTDITKSDCSAVFIFSPLVVNTVDQIDRLAIGGKRVVLVGTDAPRSRRAVYCGPTNSELGRAAADVCAKLIPEGRQTVMLMHGATDRPTSAARLTGFKDQLQRNSTLEIFKELNCEDDTIEAQRMVFEDPIADYPLLAKRLKTLTGIDRAVLEPVVDQLEGWKKQRIRHLDNQAKYQKEGRDEVAAKMQKMHEESLYYEAEAAYWMARETYEEAHVQENEAASQPASQQDD